MKKLTSLLLCLISLFSCNQSSQNKEDNKDSTTATEQAYVPEIEKTSDKTMKSDFFIISTAGAADVKDAVAQVKKLQSEGHPAGYLWMPDYESLNNKEMYSVFVGPFAEMDTCIRYLEIYKKTKAEAYAVKVQHKKERVVINNKFDIRINDVRQFLILTYSTTKDEEKYAADGGEDWGWFTNDVATYFNKNHADKVIFGSVYNGWLNPVDIKQIEKEMQLKGFGYVLIKGKEKTFLSHNLPDGIISETCTFFGLEYKVTPESDMGD
jgi:hypothetical protein